MKIVSLLLEMAALALLILGVMLVIPLVLDIRDEVRQSLYEDSDPMYAALGCSKVPCTVNFNGGGTVRVFMKASLHARVYQVPTIIDGRCISACALFADWARPFVCVTALATMEFHKTYIGSRLTYPRYLDPAHAADIDGWVLQHGGYKKETLLVMNYDEAKKFWPSCTSPKSASTIRHPQVPYFSAINY